MHIHNIPHQCRFVKHIGQRTQEEKANRAVSWGSCLSGGCGRRAVLQGRPANKSCGRSKSAFGPPGGCAPLCRCDVVYRASSLAFSYSLRRPISLTNLHFYQISAKISALQPLSLPNSRFCLKICVFPPLSRSGRSARSPQSARARS